MACVIAVRFLTPSVGKFLRSTPFFGGLPNSISKGMGLESLVSNGVLQTQTEMIEAMNLPDFLKNSLLENNNPVIYQLLDVEEIQGYIAGFLANICINIVSVILVFLAVYIGAKFLLKALNLFSKLPGLNFINRFSGFLVGCAQGLVGIWFVGIILTFVQCNAKFLELFATMDASVLAKFLYENNVLLYIVLTIFT